MKKRFRELQAIVEVTVPELNRLKNSDVSKKPAPDKWSKKEILGHLIDSAANNHHRLIRAQQQSKNLIFPTYNQDEWIQIQRYQNIPWKELITLWQYYNLHLARIIKYYPEDKLDILWIKKPDEILSIRELIIHYVWHTRHHLDQLLK